MRLSPCRPPLGKLLSLLRAGQASAQVFGELLKVLHGTIAVLETFEREPQVLDSLLMLIEYESGLAADSSSLRKRCADAIESIENVLSPIHHTGSYTSVMLQKTDVFSDSLNVIPQSFFERNEASWRGRVHEEAVAEAYHAVGECAKKLAEVVAEDFWGSSIQNSSNRENIRNPVVQDIFNNLIALKEIPKFRSGNDKGKYFHPRDRNGKLLKTRYTTEDVQSALADYIAACDAACKEVSSVLVQLSRTLHDGGHLPAIVQASHANLVLSCAYFHACQANRLGWNVAESFEPTHEKECAISLKGVWPYWINKSNAVANSFGLSGIYLLTAPNMSGKSTLMRSTAAVALLTACGLCAPVESGSEVRRFDNIFVRGASSDIPTEQKSAFGAEMGDIAAMLRCCGSKSLVFVDELGRGTSPREGTRLAGAIVESMANAGISGIFATHLHDILQLPLNCWNTVVLKRMAVDERQSSSARWTFKLEDGVCTNSMALETAAHFGLPSSIIQRAQEFSNLVIPFDHIESTEAEEIDRSSVLMLQDIVSVAESVTQQSSIIIPPAYHPPASLDGRSTVYVLELNSTPRKYYVGETDDVRSRILQHRRKGGMWSNMSAIVVPAPGGKSQARIWESCLIQSLASKGLFLESVSDGRYIRSSNINGNHIEAN
jgi:DNA mismatch repair ATPase MutS